MDALANLAREGKLSPPQRDRLREAAGEALSSPAWDGATSPLIALFYVGAPPDLLDPLWLIAMAEPPETERGRRRFTYATHWASEVLVKMTNAPALDARVAEEGDKALRSRDYERFDRIAPIGCQRRVEPVLELAWRCIDALDEDPAARDTAIRCGYWLKEAGRISDEWLLASLGRPESPRFGIATRLARGEPSPVIVAALKAALEETARGGAAAAEAAEALVVMREMKPDDARIEGILDRAPLRERASLAGLLVRFDAPLSGLHRHITDVLLSGGDELAAATMLDDLYLHLRKSDGVQELLESVLARSPPASIRTGIEHILDRPGEADLYFQDAEEEEDSEGDDDEGDDDENDRDDERDNAGGRGLN
jgi:hypothetical protein